MADIITPILNIVSVLCSCSANNRCCYLFDLQENKEDLNNALVELRATRDGVKRRVDEAENNPNELMKRTPQVDGWLQRAQTIEDEVGEILEKVDQEIEGRCFGGNCPINCWRARKIGKLVLRTLSIVNDLKSKGDLLGGDVAYKLPPPSVQEEPVNSTLGMESMFDKVWRLEPVNSTVGMESMFDKVWRLLAEDEVRIMGIYGYGGVGKTTLLKQINNEFLKTTTTASSNLHGFDVVILVVVSKALNIDAIQMEIGKRLGLSSPDRTSIFNALTKKNFVLLLDDLWERVDLQSIGIPPSPENKKSKVIFTTRSEIVCRHMDANIKFRVECLPWEKAWTLFQEKVGNETLNSHPNVPELAKMVARACDGLPLALITIGRAMSTKKTLQEWNHAITTLWRRPASEFPGMGEPVFPNGKVVFPILKVSYDSLGNDTIKSCFLYCALFPEDHSIEKAQLVDYWIGEGFISLSDFNHIDEARNYGYDVIGDLKGACLLESGEFEKYQVKMHDTIRDMALWITRECGSSKSDKLLIIDALNCTSERLWYNAERICLISFCRDETEVPTPKSPNLVTLIHKLSLWSPAKSLVPQNFFEYMPHLRVLDLTNSKMETFPTSITGLLELRYLSLSGTDIKEVPEELGKLVKLNYLNLSLMSYLKQIASGVIGSLLKLRVLNLHRSWGDWDLDEVYKLKHLNDLGITIKTQHNLNKLLSNKYLQMCTTHLFLQFPEANMVMGIEQQQHLGSSCFQNLIQIEIWSCNAFKDLTWVGYVGNLKRLDVSFCYGIEEIVILVDDFGGTGGDGISTKMMNIVDIFKSLKTLRMRSLPKLKSICSHALDFPCLEELTVDECPQLKKLPLDYGSNVNNTLQKIQGERKWWSELQWEDRDDVKSKFLPYFIDYGEIQDETIKSKFLPYHVQQKAGSMFEKAWSLPGKEDDDEIRIIGLYGQGGVGKTTLLNQYNNEFIKSRGRHGLDVVIPVLVPKPINVEAIQMKIGEGLKLPFEADESRRTEEIFNVLRDKKFVLLLDDICERIDLRCIGVPFPQGKSKIIFTTRTKAVCQLMEADKIFKVECLPWDKAWSLFQEKVGEEALNSHPKVAELAEVVAKECGGLPLALVTIGRAMSTKKTLQEWNHAITTLRRATSDFPGMGDDAVLRILKLSYDSLHNDTIKSCFLYCALYPEHHSIPKSQLIDFWIGEEFFQWVDDIDEVRNGAFNVIESLQGAFLLESGEDDDDTSVKMHDVIRDLALWIVNEFGRRQDKSLVERVTGTPNTSDKWENAERIYLSVDIDTKQEDEEIQNDIQMETPPRSPNLLTLMVHGHSYYADLFLPQNFFQFMPLLRVLDFSELEMEEFPTSITELVGLQYLGLAKTSIEALPDELRKLVNLKYLDLSHTYFLRKIPPGVIASLSELRVFNQYYSDFGDWEEDGLSLRELASLRHLNDLGITIETALALQRLLRNRKLRMCTRRLTINECIDLKSLALLSTSPSSTAIPLSLGNLKRLKELTCQNCSALEELTMNWAMVEDGQKGLLSNLETLTLWNLPRLNVVWEKQFVCSSFQNLKEISIIGCNALKDLTWLVYVRNLEILYLRKCQEVEEVLDVNGFGGGDEMLTGDVVFGRLKNIYLGNLLRLESICKHALAFPSLKSMVVEDCPHLKKLPLDCDSNVNNTLQRIEGRATWWNQLYWKDDHVKSMFLPYFDDQQ